jgi:hypothetical protein
VCTLLMDLAVAGVYCSTYEYFQYGSMCREWSVQEVLCVVSKYVVSACIIGD